LATVVGLALGCDSSDTGEAGMTSTWPADATKLVAEDIGNGPPGPVPAGSACSYTGSGTYTFTPADLKLAWHICTSPGGQMPYQFVDAERILSSGEAAMLGDALKAVTVSSGMKCGADKDLLRLKVTTPAGEKTYVDDFDACQKPGVYVTSIDGVFSVSAKLAH
jgi:hypothetical protein